MKKFLRGIFGGLGSTTVKIGADDPKRYRIQKKIGAGGHGSVFEAKDRMTGDIVAVKKVRIDKDGNAEHELNLNLAISHRNIIGLLGHYREKRKTKDYNQKLQVMDLCLVLEYSRTTLRECIIEFRKKQKAFPSQITMVLTFQMFCGLQYLHSLGIIHRDIKPSNLLVNKKTFILKLSDLGQSAQMVPGEARDTRVCSSSYRAPELELANEDYNEKIDIWSAGCVVAECYTGKILFNEVKNVQHFDRIRDLLGDPTQEDISELQPLITEPPPANHPSVITQRFAAIRPRVPETAVALIRQCLTYRPSQRPSAIELMADHYYDALRETPTFDKILFHGFTEAEVANIPFELIEHVIPERARNEAVLKRIVEGRTSLRSCVGITYMSAKTARSSNSSMDKQGKAGAVNLKQ